MVNTSSSSSSSSSSEVDCEACLVRRFDETSVNDVVEQRHGCLICRAAIGMLLRLLNSPVPEASTTRLVYFSLMDRTVHNAVALTDVVALMVGHRTCDLQVAGWSPGWAPLRSRLGQATYTCVPLLPSSIIWYRPTGVISFLWLEK